MSYAVGSRSAPDSAAATDGDGGQWATGTRATVSPTSLEAMKAYLRARIKARRRMSEEDGVLYNGIVYDTSDDAHLRLMTLLTFAGRDPDYQASILLRDGSVKQMSSGEIYAVATTIANHIQATAQWEVAQMQLVADATTIEDLQSQDAALDDSAPAGDVTEPVSPDGLVPPAAYDDVEFEKVVCDFITVNENAIVTKDLTVDGNTQLNGTLTTVQDTTLNANLQVDGNTQLQGTLTTVGNSELQGTLTTVQATDLQSTLTVAGATALNDTLVVANNTTLNSELDVVAAARLASTLAVTGATTMTGDVRAENNVSIGADLGVDANTTLTGTLTTVGATALQSTLSVTDVSDFNAKVTVNSQMDVTEDADIQRLYAHDKLGVGTMAVDAAARARTEQFVKAGSFFWRRGDRQPTNATVAFSLSTTAAQPAVAFYELERQQVIGFQVADSAGTDIVRVTMADTLFTDDDDTAFLVEVYIANSTNSGTVNLNNYFISCA